MNFNERLKILTEIKRAPVVKLTPELMIKINGTYEKFSSKKGFPADYCGPTAWELRKLGFQGVLGFFQVGRSGDLDTLKSHAWAEDADEKIIDLTATQYNRERFINGAIPSGVLIIDQKNPLYRRYVIRERFPTEVLFPTLKEIFLMWKSFLSRG